MSVDKVLGYVTLDWVREIVGVKGGDWQGCILCCCEKSEEMEKKKSLLLTIANDLTKLRDAWTIDECSRKPSYLICIWMGGLFRSQSGKYMVSYLIVEDQSKLQWPLPARCRKYRN